MKLRASVVTAAGLMMSVLSFMAGRISASGGADQASLANEGVSGGSSRQPHEGEREDSQLEVGAKSLGQLGCIVRGEDPLERARAWLAYLNRLAPDDFQSAVSRFRELGISESRASEYEQLLSVWAKVDPMAALADAQKQPSSLGPVKTILAAWASYDPDAALKWAQKAYDGNGGNPYLEGVIRGVASTDLGLACQLLSGMPESHERNDALGAILPYVIAQGAEAACAWIAELPDESLRDAAMRSSAQKLAVTNPAATAAMLQANPGWSATYCQMTAVYRIWAKANLDESIESYSSLPAGRERSNALCGVIDAISLSKGIDANGSKEALELLDRNPDDVTHGIITTLILSGISKDPERLVNLASHIRNETERNETHEMLLSQWLKSDEQAAKRWMRDAQLPQGLLERLAR